MAYGAFSGPRADWMVGAFRGLNGVKQPAGAVSQKPLDAAERAGALRGPPVRIYRAIPINYPIQDDSQGVATTNIIPLPTGKNRNSLDGSLRARTGGARVCIRQLLP
jgi:hypothetical protein